MSTTPTCISAAYIFVFDQPLNNPDENFELGLTCICLAGLYHCSRYPAFSLIFFRGLNLKKFTYDQHHPDIISIIRGPSMGLSPAGWTHSLNLNTFLTFHYESDEIFIQQCYRLKDRNEWCLGTIRPGSAWSALPSPQTNQFHARDYDFSLRLLTLTQYYLPCHSAAIPYTKA